MSGSSGRTGLTGEGKDIDGGDDDQIDIFDAEKREDISKKYLAIPFLIIVNRGFVDEQE